MCTEADIARLERKIDNIWEAIDKRRQEDSQQDVAIARLEERQNRADERWQLLKYILGGLVALGPTLLGLYHIMTRSVE